MLTKSADKSNEYFYRLFKTQKARELAREINEYLYDESPYKKEVEDFHKRYKGGKRTDCIGYISKKGSYKFATITMARKVCFILHLGKKYHAKRAQEMQKEIDQILGQEYQKTDNTVLTPGEVYIRLEWVEDLSQIKPFIDEAYQLRLINNHYDNYVKELLDGIIKATWLESIPHDYDRSFLLYEDSLKSALYFHLRRKLEEAALFQQGYRIFTEYRLASNQRADIAIVKIDSNAANENHLSECVTSTQVLIEIKYIYGNNDKGFKDDIKKLIQYANVHTSVNVYAAFITEPGVTYKPTSWMDSITNSVRLDVRNKLTELSGYRDQHNKLSVSISSHI
ncbi:hypothetical protein [Fictibacillus barbaricus]|uniref:Restriction endonuclease n=1 Tax=Fictibacillus barbaricus TaxID=182136 RepID=A0ABU1U415_9BACL|nr:hypothetical protein [Fictibacillus barbaricus]MDR7074172.1 hypothetical protein [Fictibacillus barbaricus]